MLMLITSLFIFAAVYHIYEYAKMKQMLLLISAAINPIHISWSTPIIFKLKAFTHGDFLGGTVVKNPLANAGDMGSIPGPEGSHVPQGN